MIVVGVDEMIEGLSILRKYDGGKVGMQATEGNGAFWAWANESLAAEDATRMEALGWRRNGGHWEAVV